MLVAVSGIAPCTAAETMDRVVASIGNTALTASDVEKEYRFELFQNGRAPATPPDPATLERVRDRLIDQRLLADEAEAENIERADLPRQATEALNEVRKKYPSAEAFQSALQALGTSEGEVLSHLEDRASVLRLIDQRLRPAAWVEQTEIETYYHETFVPEYARHTGASAPALEEVESQIREILVQQKIDQLLATWLQELRASRRVRLHSF